MAVNPDPKPGRWILPLVILGMVAFTYFFVRELPEASPDTTLLAAVEATTTTTAEVPETTQPDEAGEPNLDPETQAYLDAVDEINNQLQALRARIVTVNAGFDADPREVEYAEIETALEEIEADTQALVNRLGNLTVPASLQINHDVLMTAIQVAVTSANDALAGLRSTDTGEQRRASTEAFAIAADDFDSEVTNAHNNATGTDA